MRKKTGTRPFSPRQQQQGDVLLDLVTLPVTAKRKEGKAILAYGEVTGHCHEVMGEGVSVFEDEAGLLYVTVEHDVPLTHQEHHMQLLEATPSGMAWRRRIVQEYDHFVEEAKNVRD